LKNAPILILDDATASIDPDQEEQIQEAVGALARGKTLIVIAHRIRTIMNFDNMLLIRDGSVCAQGSHAELLKSSPEYQSMFRSYAETENWVMEVGKEGSGC
jgi:ATP-binding cassette subfamily B protein